MTSIPRFKTLQIWENSKQIGVQIYHLTKEKIFDQDRSFRDQIRKSIISISSNIAEGSERNSNKEFMVFLGYAKGSCGELITQWEYAYALGYIDEKCFKEYEEKIYILLSMIGKLIYSLSHKSPVASC